MKNLIYEKTRNLPKVDFKEDGKLLMEGRIIAEDSSTLFNPMYEWIDKLTCTTIEFNIQLDYINTSASKYLYTLLKKLNDNMLFEKIEINWYYEEGDDDHLYLGHDYEDDLENCDFSFHIVSENEIAA